jgi:hypothetical protein
VVQCLDLVAKIMAFLPMSKEKVTLQLVSKVWKEAMCLLLAHSVSTQDIGIPYSGTFRKVTQVLRQCTLESVPEEMRSVGFGWLGSGLQALSTSGIEVSLQVLDRTDFRDLSVLHNLQSLRVSIDPTCHIDLSVQFPNLKFLDWECLNGGIFPSHLERLTKLMKCDFSFCNGFDASSNVVAAKSVGKLPDNCKVVWCDLQPVGEEEMSNVPEGLLSQITTYNVSLLDWEDINREDFDFAGPEWVKLRLMSSLHTFIFDINDGT